MCIPLCVCVCMCVQAHRGAVEGGGQGRRISKGILRKLQNILRRHRSHSADLMRKLHHTVDLVLTPAWKLSGAQIHELGGQLGNLGECCGPGAHAPWESVERQQNITLQSMPV